MVMNMAVTIKIPNTDNYGTINETHRLYLNQKLLSTLPIGDPILEYVTTRYISSKDLDGFFAVYNLNEWLQYNCKLDENDINFLNLKLRNVLKGIGAASFEEMADKVQFTGNICRNAEGEINGVNLRILPYASKNSNEVTDYVRIFFKFFYNKNTDAFELWYDTFSGNQKDPELDGQTLNAWRNHYSLIPLQEYTWNSTRKTPLDLDETIFVTEGIYDSLFLENSVCAGGMVSTLIIPEKLKKKKLLFIIDNQYSSGIYKTVSALIKMGYDVLKWPDNLRTIKDFNEYADFLYKFSNKTLKNDEFINDIKNNIRKLVYSEENIFKGGDIEAYDKWFFNR